MLLNAGIRIALTGHAAAIFPTLYTALESACYAYRMIEDEKLEKMWADRHQNAEKRASVENTFTSAVNDAARSINAQQAGSGAWIYDIYQPAIDFGAHPNPRSILLHLKFSPDDGDA